MEGLNSLRDYDFSITCGGNGSECEAIRRAERADFTLRSLCLLKTDAARREYVVQSCPCPSSKPYAAFRA